MKTGWTATLWLAVGLWSQAAHAESGNSLNCTPALPYFCANMHVGCAGRSTIPADIFTVEISNGKAVIMEQGKPSVPGTPLIRGNETIITLEGEADWIRIDADNRYSHRRYIDGKAWMSVGTCQTP